MKKTLIMASPHLRGPVVRDCQYLLNRNRFGDFMPGKIDGVYGEATGAAVRRAKHALGYAHPDRKFGPTLYAYLTGSKKLSLAMRARRKLRLRKVKKTGSRKLRALNIALSQVGIREYPAGSNRQKFGSWYGFNGVPWCAEFVSYCMSHAGIPLKTALAFQFEYWARAHAHGLSITASPQPGDIVVYHHGQGHVGIFRRWTNRHAGEFEAVEGNTSGSGSQDNGGICMLKHRDTGWTRTVFVRVGP